MTCLCETRSRFRSSCDVTVSLARLLFTPFGRSRGPFHRVNSFDMNKRRQHIRPVLRLLTFIVAFGIGPAGTIHQAQSHPLAFEAATLKPTETKDPRGVGGGGCRGADNPAFMSSGPIIVPLGQCRFIRVNLKRLVSMAYGIEVINGVPGWGESEFYDIQGKAEDTASVTKADLTRMLQQFMAERFKLQVHRETKGVDGYALMLAKTGSKLKPATNDDQAPGVRYGDRNGEMSGRVTTAGLARVLGTVILRSIPVSDETGLTGIYDFTLKWTPDPNIEVRADNAEESRASLFTALQEQLGLRLEARKNIPIDVIMIDSAEKP